MNAKKSVRHAVQGIARDDRGRYILIHKVKIMDGVGGASDMPGEWLFPGGGVHDGEDLSEAVLREMQEETGSVDYEIISELDERICFDYNKDVAQKLGYTSQETTVFLLRFTGNVPDVVPQDEEIDQVVFASESEVLEMLHYANAREYFVRNVLKGKMSKSK